MSRTEPVRYCSLECSPVDPSVPTRRDGDVADRAASWPGDDQVRSKSSTDVGMRSVRAILVLGVLANAALAQAQMQAGTEVGPKFEVASIKPTAHPDLERYSMDGGPGTSAPGQFTCLAITLEPLIRRAWRLQGAAPWQLVAPRSVNTDRYDVVAKVPAGATMEQFLLMIQNLLAERLDLAVHKEMRDIPVYDVVVAKGGLKMKAVEKPPSPAPPLPPAPLPKKMDADGFPELPPGIPAMRTNSTDGNLRLAAHAQTLSPLLILVQRLVGRPVVDKTGLTGTFDFRLLVRLGGPGTLDTFQVSSPEPPSGQANAPSAADPGPDIPTALETQLGLKLEARKSPVEVLVVDHVNRTPSEN